MVFFKISLAIFFLRIVIRPWQRYIIIATVTINTVFGAFLFFVALFNCGDPSKYLQHELDGICLPWSTTYGIQLTGCILNATTDWIFAVLPIFVLVKAMMPLSLKISAGFVLLLGCCGSIVSLVRIRYIKGLQAGPDFFNTAVDLCIWSIIECGLGIAAASSATLRPLLRGCLEQARLTFSSTTSMNRSKETSEASRDIVANGQVLVKTRQHDLYNLDNISQVSRFSEWTLAPVLRNHRVMGKMGITTADVRNHPRNKIKRKRDGPQENVRECAISKPPSPSPPPPTVPTKIPPPVPPKPPTPRAAHTIRRKSLKSKAKIKPTNSSKPPIPCESPLHHHRHQSIREKGISNPMPHIVSQMSSATTTPHPSPPAREDSDYKSLPQVVDRTRQLTDWARIGIVIGGERSSEQRRGEEAAAGGRGQHGQTTGYPYITRREWI